jgi:hAT family C-terminal dimerisation region
MATLLNPTLRAPYFTRHWTGELASYIPAMKTACHEHWKSQYLAKKPSVMTIPRKRTLLEVFLHHDPISQLGDEFQQWVAAPAIAVIVQSSNLFRWHVDNQESFPTLHQMALDTLSIPAMSTECERVFSSTKKLITPTRSLLKEDIIGATECLKTWWDCGIISQ